MTTELIVRVEHVRKAKLCARGMRAWFARNNIDLIDFINNGLTESKVMQLNDALANRALAIARAERDGVKS